jgi:hypothetical protein
MDTKHLLYNQVYVVLMRRWGAEEGHHYLLGVYDSLAKAEEQGKQNRADRANKYEYIVYAFDINSNEHCKSEDYCISSSMETGILLDSNREEILADSNLYTELYHEQAKRTLIEEEYSLKEKLKRIQGELKHHRNEINNVRKRLQKTK